MGLLWAKKDFKLSASGVSEVVKTRIGGINQYLLIQTENINNPILLMLHGGPGFPIPGVSNRSRDFAMVTTTKELVKHYTVVFWDQRGAGKTYSRKVSSETYTLSQFIQDAKEVIHYLKSRFNQKRIYLAGHSWGSIMGLRLAQEIPNDLHGYIGFSQIINWVENDRLCLQWTLQKARSLRNSKAVAALEACGEPPFVTSVKQWTTLRTWMARYNSMIYTDEQVNPGMKLIMSILLRSPEYSIIDIINTFRGFQLSYTQALIEEFAQIDFANTITRLDIPVMFIHGRKDLHVYGKIVEEFYMKLDAPQGKQFIWKDKSSHMFHPEDAEENERTLICLLQ
ncbi:alpha/beta hydrolase [Lysinibacillus sp. Bpr_S20]|uniref:alpha/beta fold hydrolase n=1 Tax=Lysinibacillus sp. Bpr_S20 TaxID=2933964 RepID=UPI002012969B|nr:alpha/beta hydrolase [Lysinibacillus sp. Bpr_S20]MCL1702609.1 alpha/beta hydrolase [Lysinibacillus sp. Bpr_S20]